MADYPTVRPFPAGTSEPQARARHGNPSRQARTAPEPEDRTIPCP